MSLNTDLENGKKTESDGITSMLLPSVIGIIVCAVCLAGGTFAWFTASQTTATQTIQTANYDVEVSVIGDGVTEESGLYKLTGGKTYDITLKAAGTAENGYTILRYGSISASEPKYKESHTQAIPTGESITVKVTPNADCELQIIPQWGTSSHDDNSRLKAYEAENKVYALEIPTSSVAVDDADTEESESKESVPAETTKSEETATAEETTEAVTTLDPSQYTVKAGDTLSEIAEMYGISAEKLAAYNNISDINEIVVGKVIKIPPKGYVIPETTTAGTTAVPETEPEKTDTVTETEAETVTEPAETSTDTETDDVTAETTDSEPETSEEAETEETTAI